MSNIELLELAAKAAGYEWRKDIADYRKARGIVGLWIVEPMSTMWNPLSDDGYALQLAVKLNLDIVFDCGDEGGFVRVMPNYDIGFDFPNTTELLGPPARSCAGTRRAIVRAAAEIGKRMP